MSTPLVLRDIAMEATSYHLSRPGAQVLPAAPAADPPAIDTLAEQLAEKYQQGFLAGRAAQAEEYLEQGQAAAEEKLQHALELAAKDGYAQGLAKGLEEARLAAEEAKVEADRRIAALDALAEALSNQKTVSLSHIEADMVSLCHELVCKIVGKAAPTLEGVRAMVSQALQQFAGEPFSIHLHPADLAVYQAGEGSLSSKLRWVADDSVSVGGVLVKGQGGSLDARLETQMKKLAQTLLAVRAAHRAESRVEP